MAEKKSKNGAGEEDGSGKIKIAFGSVKAADKANSKQSDKLAKMANQQKPQVKPQPQPMQAPQTPMPEQLQAMQQMKHFSGGNQTQHAQQFHLPSLMMHQRADMPLNAQAGAPVQQPQRMMVPMSMPPPMHHQMAPAVESMQQHQMHRVYQDSGNYGQ